MNERNEARRLASMQREHRERHIFTVGQVVKLKGGYWKPSQSAETFRVMATLPLVGDEPQYRIRSDDERHERVAMQDTLEPVELPAAATTSPIKRML